LTPTQPPQAPPTKPSFFESRDDSISMKAKRSHPEKARQLYIQILQTIAPIRRQHPGLVRLSRISGIGAGGLPNRISFTRGNIVRVETDTIPAGILVLPDHGHSRVERSCSTGVSGRAVSKAKSLIRSPGWASTLGIFSTTRPEEHDQGQERGEKFLKRSPFV